MNVASLQLCKELYELSGWHATYADWYIDDKIPDDQLGGVPRRTPEALQATIGESKIFSFIPAYDLGYLLRKLPFAVFLQNDVKGREWEVQYHSGEKSGYGSRGVTFKADTPEDAAAKLCIELIKRGVLTPKSNKEEM